MSSLLRRSGIAGYFTQRSRRILLTIGILWVLLYGSFTLLRPPLLDDADSVHAEVAREMVARHDWVTLYANGIRYLEKAPLLYWSMAASFSVFGPEDWAARLPLAIYTLALFVTVYLGGPRFFNSADRWVLCGTDPGYFVWDFPLQPYPSSRRDRVLVAFARHAVVLDFA